MLLHKKNIKEHNPKWLQVPSCPYMILIIEGSESRKANSLSNLVSHQSDINKMHLYAKGSYKANLQLLIDNQESAGLKYLNDSKAFIKYTNEMDDIYKNIKENKLNKKCKILIVIDNMIAGMLSNIKFNPMVTVLFIRSININISLVFITKSNFHTPKNIRPNSTPYYNMKIANKEQL